MAAIKVLTFTVNDAGSREAVTVTNRCRFVEIREKNTGGTWNPTDYEVSDVATGGSVSRRSAGTPFFFEPRKGSQAFAPGETIGFVATLTVPSSVTFERIEHVA